MCMKSNDAVNADVESRRATFMSVRPQSHVTIKRSVGPNSAVICLWNCFADRFIVNINNGFTLA